MLAGFCVFRLFIMTEMHIICNKHTLIRDASSWIPLKQNRCKKDTLILVCFFHWIPLVSKRRQKKLLVASQCSLQLFLIFCQLFWWEEICFLWTYACNWIFFVEPIACNHMVTFRYTARSAHCQTVSPWEVTICVGESWYFWDFKSKISSPWEVPILGVLGVSKFKSKNSFYTPTLSCMEDNKCQYVWALFQRKSVQLKRNQILELVHRLITLSCFFLISSVR